ncbi:MAG: hypothetical protein HZA49_01725 [Planctomycetes bacterium]|nr:hypothetical protein [Planctomycetota bacterium]
MIEENTKKKHERPIFRISIPILFIVGFFVASITLVLLETLLYPDRPHKFHNITDPLFLWILNVVSSTVLGCILGSFFTGWFYLRGYRVELMASKKVLYTIFFTGGIISALGLLFFPMGPYIDALEWWGVNSEIISFLCLLPMFIPPILWAEIGFRVAKKLSTYPVTRQL